MYIIYESNSDNSNYDNILGYCNSSAEADFFCSQNSGIHYKEIQDIQKRVYYKCSKSYILDKDKVKTYIESKDVKGFANYVHSIINESEDNVFHYDTYIKTNSGIFFYNTIESSWFYNSYPIYGIMLSSVYPNIIELCVNISITKDQLNEASKLCDDKLLEYINKCKSILDVKELTEFNMNEMRK